MHPLYSFHGGPELGTRPLKDWPCSLDRAIELLKTWYDDDKPFFTKKDLESVSNQMNRWCNGMKDRQKEMVSVKGLSGSSIYYEVIAGQVILGARQNEDWEMKEPKIRYLCYEQLTDSVKSGDIKLVEAFFPLQIEHFMNVRASDTKLPISTEYIKNPVGVDECLKTTLGCWKQTPEWVNLKALLKLVATHKITKVVGIASRSMEFGPGDDDWTFRSAVQHSLMILFKEYIEEITDKKIKCYAQDPSQGMAAKSWTTLGHGWRLTTTASYFRVAQLFH
ncbi:unnamed protein product [Penicillium nalgiovense]|nr:unnamed protein product [Penicillium nalgiovense]